METIGIALSGMQSAQTRIAGSAHNLANLLTNDFRPLHTRQVSRASGGSDASSIEASAPAPVRLEREIVGMIEAGGQYTASLRVLEVASDLRGSLIDMLA